MNVYIVEEQMVCLSDYEIQNECWIIGVFKDKKKAENTSKIIIHYPDFNIKLINLK